MHSKFALQQVAPAAYVCHYSSHRRGFTPARSCASVVDCTTSVLGRKHHLAWQRNVRCTTSTSAPSSGSATLLALEAAALESWLLAAGVSSTSRSNLVRS